MKKNVLLLTLSFLFIGVSFSQTNNDDAKKEINKKAMKLARKDAKKYRKAGWDVSPGSLPMEKLLEQAFIKAEIKNYPKSYV
jgi:CRISPR/Cas system CMR-associated protein Cmr5 small subunit